MPNLSYLPAIFAVSILCIFSQPLSAETVKTYSTETLSFNYPADSKMVVHETKLPEIKRINFTYGSGPFQTSVLLKQLSVANGYQGFIDNEYKQHQEKGYSAEVKTSIHTLNQNYKAHEIIRTTKYGVIYYLIIPSAKPNEIYTLWHMTSDRADPEQTALKAYNTIKSSLLVK